MARWPPGTSGTPPERCFVWSAAAPQKAAVRRAGLCTTVARAVSCSTGSRTTRRAAAAEAEARAQAQEAQSRAATAEAEASAGAWELAETPPRTPTLRPPSPPRDDLTPEDEAVELWRLALSKLSEELYDEDDLEDLADLEVLVASAEEMLSSGRPRCELVSFGPRPVLLTAPHCLALLRDGQSPHLVEKHTIEIASGCARSLEGSVLSWSALERRRTELLWRLSKRVNEERGRFDIRDGFLLDPRNRDPNFLATSELQKNAWFQQIRKLSETWSLKFGIDLEMLHVDVHGCQDPPNTPSHLTVGLGAMCFHAIDLGDADAYEDAICFGNAVCRELSQVLAKAQGLRPRAALVRLAAPGPEDENCAPRFSGAWRGGRHTQSQQAIRAGFTHAVQLELSKALRAILATDEILLSGFASALRAAWVQAKAAKIQRQRRSKRSRQALKT
eukprot:s2805_g14.t1